MPLLILGQCHKSFFFVIGGEKNIRLLRWRCE